MVAVADWTLLLLLMRFLFGRVQFLHVLLLLGVHAPQILNPIILAPYILCMQPYGSDVLREVWSELELPHITDFNMGVNHMGVSENRGTLFWGPCNKDPTI